MLVALRRAAERQVRSAALVAVLLALLSLIVTTRTWHERRYLDQELLFGIVESLVGLGLGAALARGVGAAAWLLLVLAVASAAWILWQGLPPLAILPNVVAAVVYARAVSALRFLRQHPSRSG